MSKVPLKFGLVVFPGFEALDAFGPLEVLNTLGRNPNFEHKDQTSLCILSSRHHPDESTNKDFPYPVSTGLGQSTGPIAQSIMPTHAFDEDPDIDVLIVPGGLGTRPKMADGSINPNTQPILDYLQRTFPKLQYLLSRCSHHVGISLSESSIETL